MRRLFAFLSNMDAKAWRALAISFVLFGGVGLVFLFGAQLTHAYATRHGAAREPKQNAVRMTEEECKRRRMS